MSKTHIICLLLQVLASEVKQGPLSDNKETRPGQPASQPAQVSERTPLRYQFSVISSRATLVAASHHTIIARIHCVTELDLSSQPQQQHHEHPPPPRRLNTLHHRVPSSHPRRWYEQVHFVQSGLPSFEVVWDS